MSHSELLERLRSTKAICLQKADLRSLQQDHPDTTSLEEYRWVLAAYRLDAYAKALSYLLRTRVE